MERAEAVGPVARARERSKCAAILRVARLQLHGGLKVAPRFVQPAGNARKSDLFDPGIEAQIRLGQFQQRQKERIAEAVKKADVVITPAQIPGVAVAGKSGTAEVGGDQRAHAWFTAFAPADDARVAVAVIVENQGEANESGGGRVAGPVARAVMEAVLNS